MAEYQHHPASYRDPSGFIFFANGNYYRQVNRSYAENYDLLLSSGLYTKLVEKKLLISHQVTDKNFEISPDWYKTLLPQQLAFISYPYEWCFDQLKDAALATISIIKIAIGNGMILKDASPYNIQFVNGKPVFIDTLSFEKYDASKPWIAYRQFCECFLFPLLLGHYLKTDMQKLLIVYMEGIPVSITAKLLPGKSKFNLGVWMHVFLQNSVSKKQTSNKSDGNFSETKLIRLITHLESIIQSLQIPATRSTWNNYYDETILSDHYLSSKEKIFRDFISDMTIGSALDLGCNNGYFSQIVAEKNVEVIAMDFDSQCINELYLAQKKNSATNILPLCIDITNPSPAIGFRNKERSSFEDRAKSDLVIALAVVHHLVLGKNIPLMDIASLLADLTKKLLIVEFIPLDDQKSQQLIASKTNYHQPYDEKHFETLFRNYFEIERKEMIPGTARILYKMKKLSPVR